MDQSADARLNPFNLTYSIVVCTKNRPNEIRAFKENLYNQVSQHLKEVILVDGSNLEANLKEDETPSVNGPNTFEWKYLRTERGKPSGLNIAMDYLESKNEKYDAVVFLDDDISFSLQDLELGANFLLKNRFCGLSPLVINENETCKLNESSLGLRNLFLKQGKINAAGENSWINQRNVQQTWYTTEWLPGGAAIYNWKMIHKLRFSPELENSILGGYALGDDVDFSIRASSIGEIGCLTTIQVIHSSPVSSNRDFIKIAQARGRWKAHLLNQFPTKFSLTSIVAFELVSALWHLKNFMKYPGSSSGIRMFLQEFLRHLD